MVRRLNVEGTQLEGIHYLRTLGNADSIRADLADHERVVLVGGSYIGCEVAASLTELGKRCTIVMLETHTLERGFGRQAGRFFQAVLEQHGIEVIGEDEVERFEGEGRLSAVVTRAGRRIEADGAVIGVGAVPDLMLARKCGLELGELGGVRTDETLATSAPGVFAAGDICEYDSPVHGRPMRIEHEDVAAAQGRTAALNMLGRRTSHRTVPYFFSDLSDWASLEYVGPASAWDSEVVRGSIDDGSFSIWYLAGDRLVAMLSVGRGGAELDHARALIAGGQSIDPAALGDPDSDLAALGG
jgi:3-phenylpropionate/trans-cinnamate dioxygenase ferredoxin reductase subunit